MADAWSGEPLAAAEVVTGDIHYRIHDVDGGELLGFGTAQGSSALATVVSHYRRIESAHPGRHLVLRQYTAPAGGQFDRHVGP